MKFLLELVACCGSSSRSSMVKEEARLLVGSVPPPPRVCRNRGRKRGRTGHRAGSGSAVEWHPSLSSISEDNVSIEEMKPIKARCQHEGGAVVRSSERNLKRKITSISRTRSYSSPEDTRRPVEIQAAMPAFSPAPFMF